MPTLEHLWVDKVFAGGWGSFAPLRLEKFFMDIFYNKGKAIITVPGKNAVRDGGVIGRG